ncbi:putative membrane protein YgcG [Loktanella ponticola]|uniref:Putative membrane protein YgcG n=1 Tax=Yoonia ponticola TaxID=1524255 RepID=A0A7W9BIV0_9RHOB|nr:TPM domain-containing protein [Yoonia ponticola]MBB5721324.1 putative membrane protein YgcG [Yoonia ponticola]
MLLLFASQAQAQTTYPDYENLYVNDYAGIIPNSWESRLRFKLEALKVARDIDFTILTINRMSDYGHDGAIEPFATGLFNKWGIGDSLRNDGILLLVSRFDRALRIELGSGYGNALDAEMQRIINTTITPAFREDAYYAGIDNGATKIIRAVTGRFPANTIPTF